MRYWKRRWQRFRDQMEDSRFLTNGLIAGLPAFVIAGGMIVLCLMARQAKLMNQHVSRYAIAADKATDESTKKLFLRKLIAADPENTAYRFALATSPDFDPESARRIIEDLAPDDGKGLAQAHLMRATLLSRKSILSVADLLAIQHHATSALAGRLSNNGSDVVPVAEAHGLLGYALSKSGKNEDALPHLRKAAEVLRQYRLPAARLSLVLGEKKQAERFGRLAKEEYQRLLDEDESNVPMRLELVQAQLFLGEYTLAAKKLSELDERVLDDREREMVVRIYLALWDTSGGETEEAIASRIRLLQKALQVSPDNTGVLERLSKVVVDNSAGSQTARRVLQKQLVAGQAPASVHLMLGFAALRAKVADDAVFHLTQAVRLEPNSQKSIAALALSHARCQPPHVDEAMRLIESLPDSSFRDPQIRGIRGQVLCVAGRKEEAVADLDAALQDAPNSVEIRECLADIYASRGSTQLADMHNDVVKSRSRRPEFRSVAPSSMTSTPPTSRPQASTQPKVQQASFETQKGALAPHMLRYSELPSYTPINHSRILQKRTALTGSGKRAKKGRMES